MATKEKVLKVRLETKDFDTLGKKLAAAIKPIGSSLEKLQKQMNASFNTLADNLGKNFADRLTKSMGKNLQGVSSTVSKAIMPQNMMNRVRTELIKYGGYAPDKIDDKLIKQITGTSRLKNQVRINSAVEDWLRNQKEQRLYAKTQSGNKVIGPDSTMKENLAAAKKELNQLKSSMRSELSSAFGQKLTTKDVENFMGLPSKTSIKEQISAYKVELNKITFEKDLEARVKRIQNIASKLKTERQKALAESNKIWADWWQTDFIPTNKSTYSPTKSPFSDKSFKPYQSIKFNPEQISQIVEQDRSTLAMPSSLRSMIDRSNIIKKWDLIDRQFQQSVEDRAKSYSKGVVSALKAEKASTPPTSAFSKLYEGFKQFDPYSVYPEWVQKRIKNVQYDYKQAQGNAPGAFSPTNNRRGIFPILPMLGQMARGGALAGLSAGGYAIGAAQNIRSYDFGPANFQGPSDELVNQWTSNLESLKNNFSDLTTGIIGGVISSIEKFISILKMGLGTLTAVTGAVVGAAFVMKEWGTDVLMTTERFRGYNIAMLGTLKTQANVDAAMEASMKIAEKLPIGYEQVFQGTKAMTLISPLKGMFKDTENLEKNMKDIWDIVIALSQIEPEWGIQGALYSLRETLSGDFMSIKRRYEIPVDIMTTIDGKPLSEVKKDPSKIIGGLALNMRDMVPTETLELTSKQFGSVLQKIQGMFDLFKKRIGESGFYDVFVSDMQGVQKNLTEFMNSFESEILVQRLSNAFTQAWESFKNAATNSLNFVNTLFGTNFKIDISTAANAIADLADSVVKVFKFIEGLTASNTFKKTITDGIDTFKEKINEVYSLIMRILPDVISFAEDVFKSIGSSVETVRKHTKGLISDTTLLKGLLLGWFLGFGNILQVATSIAGIIVNLIPNFNTISFVVGTIWSSFKGIMKANDEWITGLFELIKSSGSISLTWAGIKTGIYNIGAYIGNTLLSGIWSLVTAAMSLATAFGGIYTTLIALPNLMVALMDSFDLFEYTPLGRAINWIKEQSHGALGEVSPQYKFEKFQSFYSENLAGRNIADKNISSQMPDFLPNTLSGFIKKLKEEDKRFKSDETFSKRLENFMNQSYSDSETEFNKHNLKELMGNIKSFNNVQAFEDLQSHLQHQIELSEELSKKWGDSWSENMKKIFSPSSEPLKKVAATISESMTYLMDTVGKTIKEKVTGLTGELSGDANSEFSQRFEAYIRKNNKNSRYIGMGPKIEAAAKANEVDPYLMASIMIHETGFGGSSKAAMNFNNFAGRMKKGGGFMQFGSVDDFLMDQSAYLNRRYLSKGLTTIPQISKVYAPVGAANDPGALNQYWTGNVSKYYSEMKGTIPSVFNTPQKVATGSYAMETAGAIVDEASKNLNKDTYLWTLEQFATSLNKDRLQIASDIKQSDLQASLKVKGLGKLSLQYGTKLESMWQEILGADNITKIGQEGIQQTLQTVDSEISGIIYTYFKDVTNNLKTKLVEGASKFGFKGIKEENIKELENITEKSGAGTFFKTFTDAASIGIKDVINNPLTQILLNKGGLDKLIGLDPKLKSAYTTQKSFTEESAYKAEMDKIRKLKVFANAQLREAYDAVGEFSKTIGRESDVVFYNIATNLKFISQTEFPTFSEDIKNEFDNIMNMADMEKLPFIEVLKRELEEYNKALFLNIVNGNTLLKEETVSSYKTIIEVMKRAIGIFDKQNPFDDWQRSLTQVEKKIKSTDFRNAMQMNALRAGLPEWNRSQKQSYYAQEVAGLEYGLRNPTDSLRLGMESATVEFKNWSEQFYDAGKSLVDGLASTFETGFFDFMTGKLGNLNEMFRSIGRSILSTIGQIVSKMAAISVTKIVLGMDVNTGGGFQDQIASALMGGMLSGRGSVRGGIGPNDVAVEEPGFWGTLLNAGMKYAGYEQTGGSGVAGMAQNYAGGKLAGSFFGKLFGKGGSLGKAWDSAKTFLTDASTSWILPAAAAATFLSQPGRLWGGTKSTKSLQQAEVAYGDASKFVGDIRNRRMSDAEKYMYAGASRYMPISSYYLADPTMRTWTSGDGWFGGPKEKHGAVDYAEQDRTLKGYYKLLEMSAEEDYLQRKKLNELRKTNEYEALKQEIGIRQGYLKMVEEQFATAVSLNQFEKQDELRDKIYEMKTSIDDLTSSMGDAFKTMLDAMSELKKKMVSDVVNLYSMEYLNSRGTFTYKEKPEDLSSGITYYSNIRDLLLPSNNTGSGYLQDINIIKKLKEYATGTKDEFSIENTGYVFEKLNDLAPYLSDYYKTLDVAGERVLVSRDVVDEMGRFITIGPEHYEWKVDKSKVKEKLAGYEEALTAKITYENTVGNIRYLEENRWARTTQTKSIFKDIDTKKELTEMMTRQGLNLDYVHGGAQAFADANLEIAKYYQTLADQLKSWVDAGYLKKSVETIDNLSETAFKALEQQVMKKTFSQGIFGAMKSFETMKEFSDVFQSYKDAGGYGDVFSFATNKDFMKMSGPGNKIISQYKDPFDAYFAFNEQLIQTRIANLDVSSQGYYDANMDLFNLMAERAEHLKAKSEDAMQKLEDLLNNIDQTMKLRIAEENKTSKGDVVFLDLRTYGEMASEISKAIKNNDPQAMDLVDRLRKKLAGTSV